MTNSGRVLGSLLVLTLACVAPTGVAGLIEWQLNATFDDMSATTDPLGIDGEQLTVNLTFDTADQWQLIGSLLYVPSVAASASISDGTPVMLNSALPSAGHSPTNLVALLLEQNGVADLMDLIISGQTATGGGLQGTSKAAVAAGDNLQADHLLTTFTGVQQITSLAGAAPAFSYLLVDSTITVPAPPVFALMIIGAAAGGFRRRRSNSAA